MRIEHDVVARPVREHEWIVKCFSCDFVERGLYKDAALQIRRQHIEANTAPPGMEPEIEPPWWNTRNERMR